MIRALRILAALMVPPTLYFLYYNAHRDGVETLFFLLPDLVVCAALLAAAVHGGRQALLVAYALAAGVFVTAMLGPLWTEGLAATPSGASLGVVICAAAIVVLVRRT